MLSTTYHTKDGIEFAKFQAWFEMLESEDVTFSVTYESSIISFKTKSALSKKVWRQAGLEFRGDLLWSEFRLQIGKPNL